MTAAPGRHPDCGVCQTCWAGGMEEHRDNCEYENTRMRRLARVAPDAPRWSVGGSEGTAGRTIYRGDRIFGLVDDGEIAAKMVAWANEHGLI